jgi:hypothetical protein
MDFEQIYKELPTTLWRSRMLEGDEMFTEESLVQSEEALRNFVKEIKLLDNPTEDEILERVREVVFKFNELNEEFGYYIETLEREELYEFIDKVAQIAGLNTNEDITEEWREW